ncbi:T9SS type B sorting domain-containing protein [Flavobacterium agrisoli]|uniref:T9SS type B sorting domain-containing protein n=1 Tax=Flavobacterium agrisoli TaxID=2793066 RepID=A0A934UJE3_9FLAO|nr:T9SS type B sorting domain-containing protein [Flavobacterium agrisoli]MBK0369494.1 T9SS type B sorting domain-containing protein [Flavobacterium agrisoli]
MIKTLKSVFKKIFLFFIPLCFQYSNAQITLTNNVGTTLVKNDVLSCNQDQSWARIFKLSDFGIKPNEQFIINSGQIGISKSNIKANLYVTVYSIPSNFSGLLGSINGLKTLGRAAFGVTPIVNGVPEIVQTEFETPIVVPAGVDRILVNVSRIKFSDYTILEEILVAGTVEDKGESLSGCGYSHNLVSTKNLVPPVPNANFYINVTGEVSSIKSEGKVTKLSHNVCDDVKDADIYSCGSTYIYWAKDFTLKDFGISDNEEFVIRSGQVGISETGSSHSEISFNIYKIDDNFPASFSESDLIGSSQIQSLPTSIGYDFSSNIIQVDFDTPITIPRGVKKILVEVFKGIGWGDGLAFIAGSGQDNGTSWQRGCTYQPGTYYNFDNKYVSTADFGFPNANFYINVTGNVKNVTNHFEMNFSNICSEFLKEFSIDDSSKVASVQWNFGDPTSGTANTSTDLSPFHDFSVDGNYTVTAIVTGKDGTVETLTETIDAKEPPKAYGINNIYACENSFNTGFSTSFDTSTITQQVLGGQTDKDVTFIDGKGNKYESLPNPFTNTIKDRETITVRVSHKDNLCCYSETTFDLIVNPLPNLSAISNLIVCDDNTDGFGQFDLKSLETLVIGGSTDINVEFYHQNGQKIVTPLNTVTNLVIKEETIKVKAINTSTNCYNESKFKLIVSPVPVANSLQELIGCDDNNDGISEYFDTSKIETIVLGNQQGLKVSYFDTNGNALTSPLPNPYTNTTKNGEVITVRVTNISSNCYQETPLVLKTTSQPQINKPINKYACDEGNGYATFDMSTIEAEIIGNQSGLKITYFDSNGNQLPSPLPTLFKNTQPKSQIIKVKVENQVNSLCNSETSFNLIVNDLLNVNIEKTYFLCDLEPFLHLTTDANFDSYTWKFENGEVISNTHEVDLNNSGNYTLTVGKILNDIYCENSFEFELIRSVLPSIKEIKYKELSDNNFIEIIAGGDGDFEYSIDGVNYQRDNIFYNVQGGTYLAYVRDKLGCGENSKEVTVIDYPKFFTPNSDGFNDVWNISGINKFPNAKVSVFDRYGKLLIVLSSKDSGWNGFYNGKEVPSADYWFKANLDDKTFISGHFALKR